MHLQNGDKKSFLQVFKAMGGLQKAAVIGAAVVVVGGASAGVAAVINMNNSTLPVTVSSTEQPSSVLPSSIALSSEEISSVEPSSAEISSVEASSAPSSQKASSKPKPSSSKAPPASAAAASSKEPDANAVAGLPEGYQARFADLYNQNKDFRGWIKYTGKLDYAITQSKDNSYYLNKNFKKATSAWGNPYMDYRVSVGQSTNTIIWSHSNPKDGSMFQALKGMRKVDYYKQHPTIQFDDVYSDGTYKIVAFFVENTKPGTEFFQYQGFIDQTDDAYINNWLAEAKKRSFINTTVDIQPGDKFLTLSTCWDTNSKNYDRLITVARKVRPGEDASVDTSGATQNAEQKLPANGLYNPNY